jgi:hypothetical protein
VDVVRKAFNHARRLMEVHNAKFVSVFEFFYPSKASGVAIIVSDHDGRIK